MLVVSGCSSSTTPSGATTSVADTYGGLPSFLPSDGVQADSALTGTADRPAVTSQGDVVHVQSPQGEVSVTVTGPEVPGEGLPEQTESTTCTWTGARKPFAVSAAQFNATDHLGEVFPVRFVAGQPTPPKQLLPGRTVRFELRTIMPTGEGLMRFAPDRKTIVASWDFTVEND